MYEPTVRFFVIVGACALVSTLLFRDEQKAGVLTIVLSIIALCFFAKFVWGMALIALGLVAVVAFFKIFLSGDGQLTSGTTPTTLQSGATGYQPPLFSQRTSFQYLPSTLYHGTPALKAALVILTHNRWSVKSHSPNGVYMTSDFKTAVGYAGMNGTVVEINVSIPDSLVIDRKDLTGDSRKALDMGFRIIRNGNVYIAPTPESTDANNYFRIEGLKPVRLLDLNKNPLPLHI